MDDDLLIDRAAAIADALIVSSKKEDAHFDESARIFIKALVLFVAHNFEGRPQRNLITVHDLLTRGAAEQLAADRQAGDLDIADDMDAFTYLLLLMQSQDACDGVISGAATMVLGMGDRERGAVLSTARRNLEFIERRPMKRVLRASSFDIDQLKRDPKGMSLYLCLPPQRMGDCGRWLRLMITSCLERLYELEEAPATGHPVLFLLEEFASLKHLEVLEHAAGYAAGFGVKLWVILQDLPQLKRLYPDSWETFVGNAGVIQAFANGDATTLEYLSKKLGETEVAQLVSNTNTSLTAATNDPGVYHRMQSVMAARGQFAPLSGMFGLFADPQSTSQSASISTSQNEQIQRSPLLLPDEVERMFRREAMNELVHVKGERPFVLRRSPYHVEARFAGLFDPLPGIFGRMEAPERADPQQTIAAARTYLSDVRSALNKASRSRS
jgi:type IV secretion system protein VirD4